LFMTRLSFGGDLRHHALRLTFGTPQVSNAA
jgi:hypothetical protein